MGENYMGNDLKPIEMIFLKCLRWNTGACPHRNSIPMRLALLNPAPRVMLSEKTNLQLFRICSTCPDKKLH